MGIIRAIRQTIGGTLADQWLEVIEPENMGDQTVLTAGIRTGKGANRKGGKDSISNGSVIHVYEGQFMMLSFPPFRFAPFPVRIPAVRTV